MRLFRWLKNKLAADPSLDYDDLLAVHIGATGGNIPAEGWSHEPNPEYIEEAFSYFKEDVFCGFTNCDASPKEHVGDRFLCDEHALDWKFYLDYLDQMGNV